MHQAHPASHPAGNIVGMESQSTPAGAPIPCWACANFDGIAPGNRSALCRLPNASRVRAMPEHGCACWVREPGVDDEPGPPPGLVIARSFPWGSLSAGRSASSDLYRIGRHPLLEEPAGVQRDRSEVQPSGGAAST